MARQTVQAQEQDPLRFNGRANPIWGTGAHHNTTAQTVILLLLGKFLKPEQRFEVDPPFRRALGVHRSCVCVELATCGAHTGSNERLVDERLPSKLATQHAASAERPPAKAETSCAGHGHRGGCSHCHCVHCVLMPEDRVRDRFRFHDPHLNVQLASR
eukprot:1193727-Prorocentrum_minimum.AAC.15